MAFGGGVLISALSFDLMSEAYARGGAAAGSRGAGAGDPFGPGGPFAAYGFGSAPGTGASTGRGGVRYEFRTTGDPGAFSDFFRMMFGEEGGPGAAGGRTFRTGGGSARATAGGTTIDDLLAAPELNGPVKLAQPKVLYEFADPDLEGRSAGQKIMMRMGRDNELKVKAKLRALRRALVAGA